MISTPETCFFLSFTVFIVLYYNDLAYFYGYAFQLLGDSFHYNTLGGASVTVGVVGEEDDAVGCILDCNSDS